MRWNLYSPLIVLLCLSGMLSAQESSPLGVSGEGLVTLERPAARMRMTVELLEKGPTVKEALAKLKERQDAAAQKLNALGAEKDSIHLTKPALQAEDDSQRQQIEAMIEERIARGASVPKGLQVAKSVTVRSTLTAEWPLAADEAELLTQTKELEDKINAADLAGLKEVKKLTPEEEELEAELAASRSESYYGEPAATPGQPSFVYLARITEAELDAALKDAFEKAKTKADRLARASGSELGELLAMKRLEAIIPLDEDYAIYGNPYRSAPALADTDETEAQSPMPGSVKFQFRIEATFQFTK